MNTPNTTVIIPCSGRIPTLRRVMPHYLRSPAVVGALVVWDNPRQTPPDFDDERVRVVENRRTRGLPGARNTGLDLCDTEFFLFGEDDAYPLAGAIAEMQRRCEPSTLVGPNLFEQERANQTAEALEREMRSRGQMARRWALGWTTDVAAADPCVERGTTALVMGRLSDIGEVRFCERLLGPTFHLEDIDFQLQLRQRGVPTFMATRARWIHLFRDTTANAGCRVYDDLAEYLASLWYNDVLVYQRNKRAMRDFGIYSLPQMLLQVTARATLRRVIWFAEYRSEASAAVLAWLREHTPVGHRL